ncbi:MAG: hypothetical protein IAB75_01005 [Bacteroidetes bacterium]|uniref:Lipoprotein n=1 Tax=Candidatus Cryptobacteroides avicola TaxID=2840757 RepID=A0A940DQ71_9BACT|nr:hypothetical protein [Candidatus Cryptobacteroides avicola]
MKKVLSFFALAATALTIVSCGASRRLAQISKGEQEVNLVFSGPEYSTDKKYFRDNGFGVSKDLANAKKIATQNARQSIAAMVQSAVELLVDNYAASQSANGTDVIDGNDLQELGRTVVKTQLSGLEVVEEKAFRQADGTFRYHVCMQLSKDSLSKAMSDAIDQDVKIKIRADKDKFRAYFDQKIR